MSNFAPNTFASLLAVFVLAGQMLAAIPGTCGCSTRCLAESQQPGSSCCSTDISAVVGCCCGDQCSSEQTSYDCGCDSSTDEEQAPTQEKSRVSEQLAPADPNYCSERVVPPAVHCLTKNQGIIVTLAASPQILFCVWQT